MPDSLLIGLSALQTHKRAMEVTSHNLANATTPGYSRQRTDLVAPTPEDSAPGQIGRGVSVNGIRRIIDSLTDERLRASSSEVNRLKTLRDTLQNIELAFNEPGENGLSGVTNSLFNVLSDLSNNPESSALRSAAVQELQTWTSTVNDLSQRLTRMQLDVRNSLGGQLTAVNQLTREIADLNQQIRRQTLSGNNPNDLFDQRDRLVSELSGYLELRVRTDSDGSVRIDAGGVQLVGSDSANPLLAQMRDAGGIAIITPNGGLLRPQGGSIAALDELDKEIIPGLVQQLDTLTATIARRLNALHATGTSQSMRVSSFQASFTVPTAHLGTNLDDIRLASTSADSAGIPPLFAPSFVDAAGNLTERNLTINVRDTVTGTASTYTVRYDPQSGSESRSLQDLVQAINTGRGGGFGIVPSDAIGIPGVRAKAVAVEGGYQLQLTTDDSTKAIDFSSALDLRPGTGSWSGPDVMVSTITAIPASVGSRLQFEVERVSPSSTDLQLRITSRNPSDGATVTHGIVALAGAPGIVSATDIGGIGLGQLDIDLGAGTYRVGDRFVVELDQGGAVLMNGLGIAGPFAQTAVANASDAGFKVTGRYTGGMGLQDSGGSPPYTQWSMRVVSTGSATVGTIGAQATGNPTDPQPPVVEFSYWSNASGVPTRQTVRRTLDESLPPGSPVQIADGVYAVFDTGTLSLTNPGQDVAFSVDGDPDQAGLLPALGIGGIFTGSTAASLRVDKRLVDDPTQLNIGTTRSEGDNSNVLRLIAARNEKLFGNGAFALDDTYNATLSEVGIRIRQSDRLTENQSNIRAALENQRQQVSGINIDEEVGMLILQQQAYSAAARVITFARENIQTLLDLAR